MRLEAIKGERLENLIFRAFGEFKPGYLEETLRANPHLLDLKEVFEGGEVVTMPELKGIITPLKKVKSLWDLA